jgi:mevalonate kinase
MPAIFASAPGKVILFGEHAVVYGRPAIAVPVTQVKTKAVVTPNPLSPPGVVQIDAPDVALKTTLDSLPDGDPIKTAIQSVFAALKVSSPPSLTIRITSTIPIASGLGSGAAVSVAVIRGLSSFLGQPLPESQVCELAFQVEKVYHGHPSGIDNTVITYAKPVFFVRGQPIQFLEVQAPFTIVIGDTGVQSPTAEVVEDVRRRWLADQAPYEKLFDEIGVVTLQGRQAVQAGDDQTMGPLMSRDHTLLQEMGVSSPELDRLVEAALEGGAGGAKLCGGGRGGNMIALASPKTAESIAARLKAAGAVRTIVTSIGPEKQSHSPPSIPFQGPGKPGSILPGV